MERERFPAAALNFLEDHTLNFQYFGYNLYPKSFKWPENRATQSILEINFWGSRESLCLFFANLPCPVKILATLLMKKENFFISFHFRGYDSSQISMNIKPFHFRFQCYTSRSTFIPICAHDSQMINNE